MFALMLAASLAAVSPAVQTTADASMLLGACEPHLPRLFVRGMSELREEAPPAAQAAMDGWREQGERLRAEDPKTYGPRVCMGLYTKGF